MPQDSNTPKQVQVCYTLNTDVLELWKRLMIRYGSKNETEFFDMLLEQGIKDSKKISKVIKEQPEIGEMGNTKSKSFRATPDVDDKLQSLREAFWIKNKSQIVRILINYYAGCEDISL